MAINVFLLPLYLRYITAEEYGYLALVNLFGTLFGAFAIAQLNIAGGVQYFAKDVDKSSFRVATVSGGILLLLVTFCSFFTIGPLFFGALQSKVAFYPLGVCVLLNTFLGSVQTLISVFLKNEYQIGVLARYSIGLLVSSVGLQVLLITQFNQGIHGIVYGDLIAKSLFTTIMVFHFRQWIFGTRANHILQKKTRRYFVDALKYSLPFVPTVLLHQAQRFGDRLVLERYVSLEEIGQYALLITLLGVPAMLVNALIGAIRPRVLELMGESKAGVIKDVEYLYFILISMVYLMAILLGTNLGLLTSHPKYIQVGNYMYMGVLASLPGSLLYFHHLRLMYAEKTKLILIYTFQSTLIQLVILTLLVDTMGILAAVIALGVGSLYNYVVTLKASKGLNSSYLRSGPFRILLLMLFLTFFGALFQYLGELSVWLSILILVTGAFGLIWFLGKNRSAFKSLQHAF